MCKPYECDGSEMWEDIKALKVEADVINSNLMDTYGAEIESSLGMIQVEQRRFKLFGWERAILK